MNAMGSGSSCLILRPDPALLPTQPMLGEYLELLARIGQDFATTLNINKTLENALRVITDHLDAEAGSLFLLTDDSHALDCEACVGPVNISGIQVPAGKGIVGHCVSENQSRIVRDVRLDPDFSKTVDKDTGFVTRSILCAPLSVKNRRVGAIEMINKRSGDGLFSDEDRHLLEALASSAAMAIINARLTAQLIEQEKLRRELELAAEIQRNLLPPRRADDFPVCGVNVPARGVSGDFYDIIPLDDGRIYFNVGDVSGKGMNAALLMAKTSSLFHCLGKNNDDPGVLLGQVNRELCETGSRGMFVTLVGGIFEPASGRLRLSNAGHEPPLLLGHDRNFTAFPATAPPLGIAVDLVPETGYPVTEFNLDGGTLMVFTDGLTEWQAEDGKMLGIEGLKQLFLELSDRTPLEQLAALISRLERPTLHDDMTALLIEQARQERL